MDDDKSAKRARVVADMAKRVLAALGARALWAMIVDLCQ